MLNHVAKSWWYNKQLRDRGQTQEARERERKYIRDHVEDIRNGKLLTIGRGGYTLYYSGAACTHGYGDLKSNPLLQLIVDCGIPCCDSTTVSDEDIYAALKFPLMTFAKDAVMPKTWFMLDRLPWREVVRMYEGIGATTYNMPS